MYVGLDHLLYCQGETGQEEGLVKSRVVHFCRYLVVNAMMCPIILYSDSIQATSTGYLETNIVGGLRE